MRRNRKQTLKMSLLMLILLLGIGFAALTANLKINGTVDVSKASWDVHFENVQVTTGSVTATTAPTSDDATTTEMTYAVSFTQPGDFYEFTVDMANDGSIDAMVDLVTNKVYSSDGETEITLPNYLKSSVTYIDGSSMFQKQLLEKQTSEKIKVRVEFKRDINPSDLPSSADTMMFKFGVDYKQADDTAIRIRKKIGDSVNFSTTLNNVELENWKIFYIDGDYTYLIIDGYLPGTAATNIPNLIVSQDAVYTENSDEYSDIYDGGYILYNTLITKSYWNELVTNGKVNGTLLNLTPSENIWAMGAPTLELWSASWNNSYPNDKLYIRSEPSTDYLGEMSINIYYISDDINDITSYNLDLTSKRGHTNRTYFPYYDYEGQYRNGAESYWVATYGNDYMSLIVIPNPGEISVNCYSSSCAGTGLRPIIKLPTSALN